MLSDPREHDGAPSEVQREEGRFWQGTTDSSYPIPFDVFSHVWIIVVCMSG